MKTTFFCNIDPRKTGAFEAFLVALARAHSAAGDGVVYVFAAEPIDAVATRLREAGAKWHVLEGWISGERVHPWRFVCPALRLLRCEKPDVAAVHFGNELPSLAVAVLGALSEHKTCWVWQQDQQVRNPGRMSARLSKLRLLTLRFRHFVAVYEGGRRSMRLRGIPVDRISVIHNSAPDWVRSRPQGRLREECGIPENACLCVTVSSLIGRKRVDAVIRAFAGVDRYSLTVNGGAVEPREDVKTAMSEDAMRPPHLLLVGDGSQRRELAALCVACGVADRVHLLGLRNDVRDILLEADVLLHAATAEACSYAIIESMASGIPAVVTDSGAAREQIVDGKTGFVVGRDELELFRDRLASLVWDATLREKKGAAARARWNERYRVEVAAARYHALYRSLSGGGGS